MTFNRGEKVKVHYQRYPEMGKQWYIGEYDHPIRVVVRGEDRTQHHVKVSGETVIFDDREVSKHYPLDREKFRADAARLAPQIKAAIEEALPVLLTEEQRKGVSVEIEGDDGSVEIRGPFAVSITPVVLDAPSIGVVYEVAGWEVTTWHNTYSYSDGPDVSESTEGTSRDWLDTARLALEVLWRAHADAWFTRKHEGLWGDAIEAEQTESETIVEQFLHDTCPECGEPSVPLENVPDQSLRGCSNCDHSFWEDLTLPVRKTESDGGSAS